MAGDLLKECKNPNVPVFTFLNLFPRLICGKSNCLFFPLHLLSFFSCIPLSWRVIGLNGVVMAEFYQNLQATCSTLGTCNSVLFTLYLTFSPLTTRLLSAMVSNPFPMPHSKEEGLIFKNNLLNSEHSGQFSVVFYPVGQHWAWGLFLFALERCGKLGIERWFPIQCFPEPPNNRTERPAEP